MQNPLYRCTQPELYAVARTGWTSYAYYLSFFSDYRGYYDASFGTNALGNITAAEALPDAQARYANTEVYRTELAALGDICLARWQSLKRYISTSFPEPAIKPRLEEAGSLRYEKAANNNWEELRMMNVSASNFLTNHDVALMAGNNMPSTFQAAYSVDMGAFADKMQQFTDSEEQGIIETKAKIVANNELYTALINMFKDAQEIFKNDEEIKKQFVFESVLAVISGSGLAGIRGKVVRALDLNPIPNVDIQVLNTTHNGKTDDGGNYLIKPISTGNYDIRFVASGYQDKVVQGHSVMTGTVSSLDIELEVV